jgi:hypothetical protein
LEAVAPGETVTARANEDTPQTAAPGVETADSASGANRLLYRVPPGDVDKTVLVKTETKQLRPPADHIGPQDLNWPGASESAAKPPPAAHE